MRGSVPAQGSERRIFVWPSVSAEWIAAPRSEPRRNPHDCDQNRRPNDQSEHDSIVAPVLGRCKVARAYVPIWACSDAVVMKQSLTCDCVGETMATEVLVGTGTWCGHRRVSAGGVQRLNPAGSLTWVSFVVVDEDGRRHIVNHHHN